MLQQVLSRFRGRRPEAGGLSVPRRLPAGVVAEPGFPAGYHVRGFGPGPSGGGEIVAGAGDPASGRGAIFLGEGGAAWRRRELPEEIAFVSRFARLADGRYVAGGGSALGRGALLVSGQAAGEWRPAEVDLHDYCAIHDLALLPNGTLLAAAGRMVTQGKTKPALLRSEDGGKSWAREEPALPISGFLSFALGPDGLLYAGTAGDVTPSAYRSADGGKSWEPLPPFPSYKTYKMPALHFAGTGPEKRLFLVVWGYKTDLAERVVRIYASDPALARWEELAPPGDSHFLFSFLVTRDGVFYAGSEKGRVYRSGDFGRSWSVLTQFGTNIGAYALHEDGAGRIWIGKDFVPPGEFSLWRVAAPPPRGNA